MNELKEAKIKDLLPKIESLALFIIRLILRIAVIVLSCVIACGGGCLLVIAILTVFTAVPAICVLLVHAVSMTLTMETFMGTMRLILCCLGCSFGGVILVILSLYFLQAPIKKIEQIRLMTNTPHLDALIEEVSEQVDAEQHLYCHLRDKSYDEIQADGFAMVSRYGQNGQFKICTPKQRKILINSQKYADWR